MIKNIFIFFIALLSAPLVYSQQTIQAEGSKVNFEVSNMAFQTVKGTFDITTGKINFSPSDLKSASFNVCISAKTVNTENAKRDQHLQTEDFFDVKKYPNICFKSSSITKSTKGFSAFGLLTMHGVTKKVSIPFTFNNNTLRGTFVIDRTDFNVGSDGGFMVGKDVTLEIICAVSTNKNN